MELWYMLVDLLPFDWAEPGRMFFMKNALLAVLVITPLFGLLSTMVSIAGCPFSLTRWATPPLPVWPSGPYAACRTPPGRR